MLSGNQLTKLPESITKLSNLTDLDLSNNQLIKLPESITKLSNLTTLLLSGNQLTKLPESITNFSNLTWLDLSNNQIKKIPLWFAENKMEIHIDLSWELNGIHLSGNPIEEPPLEVVKQGNEGILNYYAQIATQGKDYIYEAKMLIVGEGGAGKTTLAHKIKDTNCPLPQIDDRTKGITINIHDFSVPTQNETETRSFLLNVWDFGGQEIYHATHRFFLSRRSLYVLVADNREDNTDFNYWLNIIKLFAEDSPILIVLNEKDDLQRKINASELGKRYPESLKKILRVNFKTYEEQDIGKRQQRLKRIGKVIRDIEHHASDLPHIGEPVPALWVDVRQAVENHADNYIYLQEFIQICHDQGITNDQDIDTLLSYFHDLGIVLHFADNPLLSERVILKPAWATNAVYCIFDNDLIKAQQGRFTRTDCSALWRDNQYKYMDNVLIELMKNFLLVYQIEDTENLIAPQMLPQDTPDYSWNDANNSLMQFRYDLLMPKGILWEFIVMMYRYIKNHSWVWRNGVILERDGTIAEVIENLFERRIYIRFNGTGITEFRAIITDQLDAISQSYHNLEYEKMIPCSCSVCRDSLKPHFFKFSTLEKRKAKRIKSTIECEISGEDVPLSVLLEGFEISQTIDKPKTSITQYIFHGDVGTVTGKIDGTQNVEEVKMEGDRITNVKVTGDRSIHPNPKNMTTKILVLESNPRCTDQLLLNQEISDIEAVIRNASQRNLFSVKPELAVTVDKLQPSILREKPRILHFCGHGTGTLGLVVQTASGESQLVNTEALANLFKQFSARIECVILNACYSEVQTQVIHQHINYVIGTTAAIEDSVAILFSKGFYGALAEGRPIESAFNFGLNRIELEIDSTHHLERKLVPVDSGMEQQYRDRSGKLVLTLLKKEPLSNIISSETEAETMSNKSNITINQGNYNQQTGNSNTMTNITQSSSGSGNNIAGDENINQSENITISGNAQVTASGAGAFSLGDISGTVANTINELPLFENEPEKKELKELLDQLQTAVMEAELDEEEKEESLDQIKAIASSLTNSQDGAMKKVAKRAMKMLRGTAAALPPGAALVTICDKLPELISKIF